MWRVKSEEKRKSEGTSNREKGKSEKEVEGKDTSSSSLSHMMLYSLCT